jgi:GNAT superfamily N-acetyltransferase
MPDLSAALQTGNGALEGFHRTVLTALGEVTLGALLSMIDAAWHASYRDVVRPHLNEHFLRKITACPGWFGVIVYDPSGLPAGFEIAFPRTLRACGRSFEVYYVTAFSVSAAHRRRGVGRWVLEGINHEAFENRAADLLFSTFDRAQAGTLTVQSTFERSPYTVHRFHETPLFVRRFDSTYTTQPSHQPTLVAGAKVVNVVSMDGQTLAPRDATIEVGKLPTLAELDAGISAAHEAAFALTPGFVSQYLNPEHAHQGESLWFAFDDGAWCWINYGVNSLAFNEHRIGQSGQLQTLFARECSPEQIELCVRALIEHSRARGLRALVAFDHLALPSELLTRLKFSASPNDRFNFCVRGPAQNIELFRHLQAPYFLDFL